MDERDIAEIEEADRDDSRTTMGRASRHSVLEQRNCPLLLADREKCPAERTRHFDARAFVLALEAPLLAAHQRYRAFKVSKRFDEDISAVMLAARFDLDGRKIVGARVACGGMAATPKRAAKAERALVGASLDKPATWRFAREAIDEDFTPLTDMRATAAYRKTIAANLLEKTLIEIAGGSAATRIGMLRAAE